MAFDDHLRSHQDINLPGLQPFEYLLMGTPSGSGIVIHPAHLRPRE
jgi:hypothetical protein